MFQIIIQSFVRGEVTVGIVLTLLLISGRSNPQTLAFSLGGVGVFLLLQGFIPLSRRGPARTQAFIRKEKASGTPPPSAQIDPAEPRAAASQKAQPVVDRPTTLSPCACAKKPFNRREYFARAAISSLVIIGTAALIYWFAPPIV